GSKWTPSRGLHDAELETRIPSLFVSWFLSQRSPRLTLQRAPSRRRSLTQNECVSRSVLAAAARTGYHWICVVPSSERDGKTSVPRTTERVSEIQNPLLLESFSRSVDSRKKSYPALRSWSPREAVERR